MEKGDCHKHSRANRDQLLPFPSLSSQGVDNNAKQEATRRETRNNMKRKRENNQQEIKQSEEK